MNRVSVNKRAARLLFLFVSVALLSACSDPSPNAFKLSGSTMGTSYHITVLESTVLESAVVGRTVVEREGVETQQADLKIAIEQQLLLIDQQMSTYKEDSELSRLNDALVDEWVKLSPDLLTVLMLSLELGWLSNGAFDITVGPLVKLWGFGPGGIDRADSVPTAAKITDRLKQTGFQHIEFNLATGEIRKRRLVTLDLSAIAKGYGVDKVAELLLYAGFTDFMVEIGGELRLQGNSPRGTPWRIAIEQPDASFGAAYQTVKLSGVGMATSGDYRNYFEQEGKRYSHIIDPATGYPIDHALASVTVIAETAAYADGLATAINVMGPEKGLKLAQQQGLAVYMIMKTKQGFAAAYSDAFKPYLE
ncbi:MAG: FAD:protein FMN transferase [Pseudomonadales bacterium]